jgi:hypothetical protein
MGEFLVYGSLFSQVGSAMPLQIQTQVYTTGDLACISVPKYLQRAWLKHRASKAKTAHPHNL